MELDIFGHLATGFGAAASFQNICFALIGCLLGTLIGVLPGIGPIADHRDAAADHLRARSAVGR